MVPVSVPWDRLPLDLSFHLKELLRIRVARFPGMTLRFIPDTPPECAQLCSYHDSTIVLAVIMKLTLAEQIIPPELPAQ